MLPTLKPKNSIPGNVSYFMMWILFQRTIGISTIVLFSQGTWVQPWTSLNMCQFPFALQSDLVIHLKYRFEHSRERLVEFSRSRSRVWTCCQQRGTTEPNQIILPNYWVIIVYIHKHDSLLNNIKGSTGEEMEEIAEFWPISQVYQIFLHPN